MLELRLRQIVGPLKQNREALEQLGFFRIPPRQGVQRAVHAHVVPSRADVARDENVHLPPAQGCLGAHTGEISILDEGAERLRDHRVINWGGLLAVERHRLLAVLLCGGLM